MSTTAWLACGLASFIIFVLTLDRNALRNLEFFDCAWLAILLTVLLALGPIGLAVLLTASALYGVTRLL